MTQNQSYTIKLGKPVTFGKPRSLTNEEFYDITNSLGFNEQTAKRLQRATSKVSLPGGYQSTREFYFSNEDSDGNIFAIDFENSEIKIYGPKARNPTEILNTLSGKYNVLDSHFSQFDSSDFDALPEVKDKNEY